MQPNDLEKGDFGTQASEVLAALAWLSLIGGFIGAIWVWGTFGSTGGYHSETNPLGVATGIGVLVQGIFVCVFFLVVAHIGRNVAMIRMRVVPTSHVANLPRRDNQSPRPIATATANVYSKDGSIWCSYCKTEVEEGSHFCWFCGVGFTDKKTSMTPSGLIIEYGSECRCRDCQAGVSKRSKFCPDCGVKFDV